MFCVCMYLWNPLSEVTVCMSAALENKNFAIMSSLHIGYHVLNRSEKVINLRFTLRNNEVCSSQLQKIRRKQYAPLRFAQLVKFVRILFLRSSSCHRRGEDMHMQMQLRHSSQRGSLPVGGRTHHAQSWKNMPTTEWISSWRRKGSRNSVPTLQ